jgi:hypothetical protein
MTGVRREHCGPGHEGDQRAGDKRAEKNENISGHGERQFFAL